MTCHQAQDLMYLYRPGELTGELRQDLEEHLASCPTCSAELKAVLEMDKNVSGVRNIEPRLEDAVHLTRTILRAAAESRQRPKSLLGSAPEWTVTPAFRIAACITVFVLTGTFFLQTSIDARKIATLEGRLKLQGTTPSTIGFQDIQRAGVFLPGTDRIAGLPDSLEAILQTLFGRHVQNGTSMIDYLARKHPRLASVRIDDGFDDREREILASDGEAFLKDIETLIQKGDVHHER